MTEIGKGKGGGGRECTKEKQKGKRNEGRDNREKKWKRNENKTTITKNNCVGDKKKERMTKEKSLV